MVWHFPHGVAQQSTIRVNGWKLIKNWMPVTNFINCMEIRRNHQRSGRKELISRMEAMKKRVDIEEANDLAQKMPEKVEAMSLELFRAQCDEGLLSLFQSTFQRSASPQGKGLQRS